MAHVHEGDKIEVAVHGKNLILRARGKQYTTHIEQKSRSGKPVSSPASPR
jgi:antitoxin component of MazEF toxin-antitoxin module